MARSASSWTLLKHGGRDGFFLVLVSLSWLLMGTPPESKGRQQVEEYIRDVLWVLECLIDRCVQVSVRANWAEFMY